MILNKEIKELKSQIELNTQHKKTIQKKLEKLEKERDEKLYNFRNEIDDSNSVDVMYNQHLLNLKDIEFARKEKQAEFHIKQREMYIENLKAQLAMRDQIIKDKLGASITNFLKQDLLTMQDIEGVSHDVLLPSLKMTKSKQFNYNTDGEDNYKTKEDNDIYNDMIQLRRKQRKQLGTGKVNYSLPNIKNEGNKHQERSKRSMKYIKPVKPTKKSVSKRDN